MQSAFSTSPRLPKVLTVLTLFKDLSPESQTQAKFLAVSPCRIKLKFIDYNIQWNPIPKWRDKDIREEE
jgi:hypothetical protein